MHTGKSNSNAFTMLFGGGGGVENAVDEKDLGVLIRSGLKIVKQ